MTVTVIPVEGLPEITEGADLARLIAAAAPALAGGDILVVTSKIISKAEGRVVRAGREQAIDAETVRVVARRGATRIVETRHGLVLAAAGVDASNTPPGTVVLLPEDPDGSARGLGFAGAVVCSSITRACTLVLLPELPDCYAWGVRKGLMVRPGCRVWV